MLILALDPGKTTGYALLSTPTDVLEIGEIQRCSPDEKRVLNVIAAASPDEVVVEAYKLYPARSQSLGWDELLPSQLIGAVRMWCAEKGIACVEQPTSVKTFFSDTVLKAVGGYCKNKPHARDAVRHALHRSWFHHRHIADKCVQQALKKTVKEGQ